jgi:cell division protein ZapA (FtsZ GTPase activity inhibitor)
MSGQNIKITIANREYPLKLNSGEEQFVKLAGEKIEKVLNELDKNYAINDKQDLLSMGLIQLAIQNEKEANKLKTALNQYETQAEQLTNQLEHYLDKQNVL